VVVAGGVAVVAWIVGAGSGGPGGDAAAISESGVLAAAGVADPLAAGVGGADATRP
jgi:hypothetical protein